MGRPSKVADWEVAIALYRGESGVGIAQRLGVSPATVSYAAKRWRDAGGAPFPRRRRGAKARLTARNNDIVALYLSGKSLREAGATLGISGEAVRQVIGKYERLTGEAVSRGRKKGGWPTGPRVPRVRWHCQNCGVERDLLPSKYRPTFCAECRNRSKFPPPEIIESWIAQRRAGAPFLRIALNAGYNKQCAQYPLRYIAMYLRDTGRLHELKELRPGSLLWLSKVVPAVAEMAAQEAAP